MPKQALQDTNPCAASFEQLDAGFPLHAMRQSAFNRYQELGIPTTRDEEWRYTNVAPMQDIQFSPAPPATTSLEEMGDHLLKETDCHRLVFVNGHYAASLSDIGPMEDGAVLCDLPTALAGNAATIEKQLITGESYPKDIYPVLNTAFLQNGAYLHLSSNVDLTRPVHLVFVTTDTSNHIMTHPRVVIAADQNARATVIESYFGLGDTPYLTNSVTEIKAAAGATIDHYRVQQDSLSAYHFSSVNVSQARDSNVTSHVFAIGSKLSRNDINATLNDEGCHSTFNGLSLIGGEQHVDHHLRIDHHKPLCNSWEFYKSILDDHASATFSGRIYVAQDAQKTDAKQTNMTLLLSDDARVTAKPQLEIFADDVRCTHGATTGQIEPDQLFYLQARGIEKTAARSLLIAAFANETIKEAKVPELRQKLQTVLMDRLPQGKLLLSGL